VILPKTTQVINLPTTLEVINNQGNVDKTHPLVLDNPVKNKLIDRSSLTGFLGKLVSYAAFTFLFISYNLSFLLIEDDDFSSLELKEDIYENDIIKTEITSISNICEKNNEVVNSENQKPIVNPLNIIEISPKLEINSEIPVLDDEVISTETSTSLEQANKLTVQESVFSDYREDYREDYEVKSPKNDEIIIEVLEKPFNKPSYSLGLDGANDQPCLEVVGGCDSKAEIKAYKGVSSSHPSNGK